MNGFKINDWKTEVDFNLRYHRWFLIPLGVWVPKKKSEKVLSQFCIFLTFFILLIYFIPHTLYILLVVTDHVQQLILFGPLSYGIMALGKYVCVINCTEGMANCLNMIEEDWKVCINKSEDKKLMTEAGQWVDNFTKMCVVFLFGGTMFHNIFVPVTNMVLEILKTPNATVMLNAPYYFGKKVYMDSSDGFMFVVLLIIYAFSFILMNLISVGLGTLLAKFVLHACCQIEIMLKELEITVNKANDENWNCTNYQAGLKLIILKHLRILRFIGYTEELFSGILFVEFIMSTLGICVLGYYILGTIANKNFAQFVTFTSILIAYVVNMYVYCYLGNRLTEMCQQVGVRAYEINWTDLLAKKYGDAGIQMIILVSQHPPILTAGKIFFLTVETFTSVMKASAAYLNMLRTVTEPA